MGLERYLLLFWWVHDNGWWNNNEVLMWCISRLKLLLCLESLLELLMDNFEWQSGGINHTAEVCTVCMMCNCFHYCWRCGAHLKWRLPRRRVKSWLCLNDLAVIFIVKTQDTLLEPRCLGNWRASQSFWKILTVDVKEPRIESEPMRLRVRVIYVCGCFLAQRFVRSHGGSRTSR